MADEHFLLSRQAAEMLGRVVRETVLSDLPRPRAPRVPYASGTRIYIALTGVGGVPARSGTAPGSAEVTMYEINDSDTLVASTDAAGDPITLTVYNLALSAVAASTYIQVKQELASGKLLVDFEDCG